jgi:pectin methylesterase-like acyl-CoA thioesterase
MRISWTQSRTCTCAVLLSVLAISNGAIAADPNVPEKPRLSLISVFPAPGATNVCLDTPLRLKFDGLPSVRKSGVIEILNETGTILDSIDLSARTVSRTIGGLPNFNCYPVVIISNEVIIDFKSSALACGKTYQVRIPRGGFEDVNGNPAVGLEAGKSWQFSTRQPRLVTPAGDPRRIVVSADGKGDFTTVQGALDSVPDGNTTPTTVYIRNGIYPEIVYFADKHNLTIVGEERQSCIITYANNQGLNNTDTNRMPGGYRRGMLRAVRCANLTLAHLTLRNSTPQGGGQAESIILNGDPNARAIITDVDMYSRQDTLQINGQAYLSDCYIEGDVDFMWGTGPCFFEKCRLRALRSASMYTQIRNPATNHGFVYKDCRFEGAPGVADSLLSRVSQARFPASEVVLLDCTLTGVVSPLGWRLDGTGEAPTVHFWEYNSRDPEGRLINDTQRLGISKRLTKTADAATITNYSNPAWVLGDGWDPRSAVIFTRP